MLSILSWVWVRMPRRNRLLEWLVDISPRVASFGNLSKPMLVKIMTEPKNSLHQQFVDIFHNEGVELGVAPAVFEQIAELAFEYKTGARSLRGIFEEMITPILYLVPDHPEIRKVEIASLFEEARYIRG